MRRAISISCRFLRAPMVCSFCGAPSPKEKTNKSPYHTACMCEACLKQAVAAMQAVCAER